MMEKTREGLDSLTFSKSGSCDGHHLQNAAWLSVSQDSPQNAVRAEWITLWLGFLCRSFYTSWFVLSCLLHELMRGGMRMTRPQP